ncbi:hypothetical protein BKA65DRAFT_597830 [Rhexocercosporidium sp. MPI-PUGE-AT-0058]|nr:hypothetical protein BKA65DRAFT_597830 [Rhexocercosporidium sp. MPI-PUGE-AT-0058]
MAQAKVNKKENVPLGGGKKGKKAGPAQRSTNGNPFDAIADDDGNAKNAKDFDKIPHTEDEVFFKVNEEILGDKLKVAQDRVDLLNFIHKELFYSKIVRHVPAAQDNIVDDTEYFHQAEYKGRKIDIGVHFYQAENSVLTARAFAKFADSELADDDFSTTIYADHALNAIEAKKDKSSKVIAGLTKFYWAPRWNFVVRYLRLRMEAYARDGSHAIEIVDPTLPTAEGAEEENDTTETTREVMVPSGCTGAIIGTKGAKINEIKSQSGVNEIKMPERVEPRPRPRELVTVTITGGKSAVDKVQKAIEAVADEWLNAPRPPRDGGSGGNGGFQQPSEGFAQIPEGSGGGFGAGDGFGGDNAGDSWADSVNNAAAAASDNFGGGGGGGGDSW